MPTVNLKDNFGFGWIENLGQGLNRLVLPAFEIAGVAVLVYLIIGAIKYMISAGDKNAVASAQQMITHAIIGFILLVLLFVIVQYVPEFFGAGAYKVVGR